jgi:predicted metal-dependent peptidase
MAQDSSEPVANEIVAARVKLLLEKPFFGNLATRLEAVEAPWCRSAATDGRRLYYNREFIKGLSRPHLLFLVAHEVLHCVLDHLGRRGTRDPKIWNMACDYIVNYILVNERIGTMPPMGLYDSRYTDEMSVYEVYNLLKQNSVTIKLPLDDHLDLGNDTRESDNTNHPGGCVEVTVMGHNGPPLLDEHDMEKMRADLKADLLQIAQQVGAGNLPLGVKRMLANLIEPKLDWRTLLDAHIRSQMRDDYTFQRLSRRTWGTGAIMPAQNFRERVECWCAIDASGSTTQEMVTVFLSEVKGIMESYADFRIGILCFDTEVYNVYEFTPENFDEVYRYDIRGGGGTMFEAIVEYFKREDIEPNRLAIFTDGLPNAGWGDPTYCDTIFIIHSNPRITAPYGLTCHYEDADRLAKAA